MTTEQKLWQFIEKLLARTEAGNIPWDKTANPDTYQASFPRTSVRISQSREDYVLSIYNEEGHRIEAISDSDLANAGVMGAYAHMRRLHEIARRRALGVDEVIDDLLDSLS